ncbi:MULTISPECIES: hypothetical protein [Streptomyces]|uniref:hypothetical protein n=1 Tax=Streptomyces TaxID=1883 RepID=UPI00117CBB50|nr:MULTISPECIES: hypothetical protein [Streptomyces]
MKAPAPRRRGRYQRLREAGQQAVIGCRYLGQDRRDLAVVGGVTAELGELFEMAVGGVPVASLGGEGVERRGEVDAVSGQQQGMGCGGGTLPLLLDGQGVRQTVVVAAGAGGGMEAAGGLQEAGRALVAPDGDDQRGALLYGYWPVVVGVARVVADQKGGGARAQRDRCRARIRRCVLASLVSRGCRDSWKAPGGRAV